jgi:hypothetical protein
MDLEEATWMHLSLTIEGTKYQVLRQRLLTEWPTIDEQCLLDTLEGITELHEMIAAVVRSALVDEALGSGLRCRLDDMKERQSRLEVRASKKRELALQAMSEAGLTKLEQPDFTASTRAGVPALIVVSEQAIPETYWLTQPPKLDRQVCLAISSAVAQFPASSSVIQSLCLW